MSDKDVRAPGEKGFVVPDGKPGTPKDTAAERQATVRPSPADRQRTNSAQLRGLLDGGTEMPLHQRDAEVIAVAADTIESLRAAAREVLRTQGHADEAGGTIDEQIHALEQLEAVLDGRN